MKRKLPNWITGLLQYVEDTEASRSFWLWGGLFTISSALQRKVWLPYGLSTVYPNLYVLIIARPGERKAGPAELAKVLLESINTPVSVDSTSKRALTKELAKSAETNQFAHPDGRPRRIASLAVVSKELSSLLAIEPKVMIEALTDLYDSHDVWKYNTSDKGHDFLYNVYITLLACSTPTWIANNLPRESIGGGFTSRNVIVPEQGRYKEIAWPSKPDPKLFKDLVYDLAGIANIIGEFTVTPEAREFFDTWYKTIPGQLKKVKDERMAGFANRMHVIALKVAICLRVAQTDELKITLLEMETATKLLDDVLSKGSMALGGHGISRLGPLTDVVLVQLKTFKKLPMKELVAMNWRNATIADLEETVATIAAMGRAKKFFDPGLKDTIVCYIERSKTDEM